MYTKQEHTEHYINNFKIYEFEDDEKWRDIFACNVELIIFARQAVTSNTHRKVIHASFEFVFSVKVSQVISNVKGYGICSICED